MKAKIIKLSFLLLLLVNCVSKKQIIQINKEKESPVVEIPDIEIPEKKINDSILRVYNELIDGIKKKDLKKIENCYADNAYLEYLITIDKYRSITKENYFSNKENILKHYNLLFKKNFYDDIEFEILNINKDILNPYIEFYNAWAYSDYNIIDVITFEIIDEKYYIKSHIIKKY